MKTIKQVLRVTDSKITIQLAPELNNTEVEVIITPLPENGLSPADKKAGLNDLLNMSVWSDNDIQSVKEVSKRFNKWKLKKF